MSTYLVIMLVTVAFLAGLAALEIVARRTKISHNIIRKAGHIGLTLVIASVSFLVGKEVFIPIGLGFFVVALLMRHFLKLRSLSKFASVSYGEALFPLGIGIAAFTAQSVEVFITCVLILGFADTAAFVCGRHFKSPKIIFNKTVAGSLAFAVVSTIIIFAFTSSWWAIPISIVLAIVEILGLHGSDNLTLPVAASLMLNFLPF